MRKYKILVADDDMDLVKTIRDCLDFEGYVTDAAHEGIRVIELAREESPDLIILDLKMPAGSGMSVLENLSNFDDTKHIPIFVITGLDDENLEEDSYKNGAKGFIRKPFDLGDLVEKIHKVLKK